MDELAKAASKFELMGTSNNRYRHKYSCVKKESFIGIFKKFMIELGFEEKRIKDYFLTWEGNYYEDPRRMKIKEMVDICDNFQNKKYDVDIFYGVKKIIILVRVKGREDLVKNIIDKSKWKKFPKIIPETKDKRKRILVKPSVRRVKKDLE